MKTSSGKQLAKKMLIAMICGLACGFGCIMLREELLLVEEERKAGKKIYTIDELDEILNEVIDNTKQLGI